MLKTSLSVELRNLANQTLGSGWRSVRGARDDIRGAYFMVERNSTLFHIEAWAFVPDKATMHTARVLLNRLSREIEAR